MGFAWLGAGAIIAYLARNRVKYALTGFIVDFIGRTMAEITENPEKVKPLIDSVMRTVLSNPAGVMPKETMIKLPIIGKVPASWFEPIIKSQLGKFAKEGVEKTAEAAGAFG